MIDTPIPQQIHRGDREIVVTWNDRHVSRYPARELRLACPCASCQEELTGRPLLDPAAVPDDVTPVSIELVGSYAFRVVWSDGHNTGIFTYRHMLEMCRCLQCEQDRAERKETRGSGEGVA